jgi:hypothetical protein
MNKRLSSIVLLAGLAFASASYAAPDASGVLTPSFDYVEILATSTNLPVTNGYGAQIDVSKTLGETLFVTAEGDRANYSVAGADTIRAGVGLRTDLAPGLVGYGEVYGLHTNVNFKDYTNLKTLDSYGYGVEGGLRLQWNNAIELRGGLSTERLTATSGWTTYGTVGAQLNLTDNLAVVADARVHSTTDREYQAGLRLSF